jgi:hypothetical protein
MAVGMAATVPARRVAMAVENFMVAVGEECGVDGVGELLSLWFGLFAELVRTRVGRR